MILKFKYPLTLILSEGEMKNIPEEPKFKTLKEFFTQCKWTFRRAINTTRLIQSAEY